MPIADSGMKVPGRQWNFVNPTPGTYVVSLVVSSLEQNVLKHRQQADCDGTIYFAPVHHALMVLDMQNAKY